MSRAPLVLDIETLPLAASLATPYPEAERSAPANYKSDDAIARWRETDRAAWAAQRVKECSLNPRLGRIASIAWTASRSDELVLIAPTEDHERFILVKAWDAIARARGRVVTWNGQFDLRWLLLRSLHHRIECPVPPSIVNAWFKRYSTRPHFDCKAVLTNWDAPKAGEGMNEWASFLGIVGKPDGMSGAAVYGLAQEGRWDAIADYNLQDVRTTAQIYQRLAPVYDPEPTDGWE